VLVLVLVLVLAFSLSVEKRCPFPHQSQDFETGIDYAHDYAHDHDHAHDIPHFPLTSVQDADNVEVVRYTYPLVAGPS
jgi:hypothetical protein